MSDYKELVRRLQMHPPQETPFVCADAIRAIDELSAQLEAEEATNDRLRDEIAEAVGARERMAAEVERLKQERDCALEGQRVCAAAADEWREKCSGLERELAEAREKAKALDDLEAWLRGPARSEAVLGPNKEIDGSVAGWSCELWRAGEFRHVADIAPTLAAAIRAALEKARGA